MNNLPKSTIIEPVAVASRLMSGGVGDFGAFKQLHVEIALGRPLPVGERAEQEDACGRAVTGCTARRRRGRPRAGDEIPGQTTVFSSLNSITIFEPSRKFGMSAAVALPSGLSHERCSASMSAN